MDIKKLDNNTISVNKVIPQVIETQTYDYDFLLGQRGAIQNALEAKQQELDDINALIAQAESLGVSSKVTQVKPDLIQPASLTP